MWYPWSPSFYSFHWIHWNTGHISRLRVFPFLLAILFIPLIAFIPLTYQTYIIHINMLGWYLSNFVMPFKRITHLFSIILFILFIKIFPLIPVLPLIPFSLIISFLSQCVMEHKAAPGPSIKFFILIIPCNWYPWYPLFYWFHSMD